MNKLLIYDVAISGHHSEYINYLVDYIKANGENGIKYIFVVHTDFEKHFPDIFEKGINIDFLEWQPIKREELESIENKNSISSSLTSMELLGIYTNRLKIGEVIVLDFHNIKYGSLFKKVNYEITTILFLQFYRLNKNSLKEKIEYYKRYLLTKWAISNKSIKRVFVLNDQTTVDFMNREFKTDVFKVLADPIPVLKPEPNFKIYEYYQIQPARKIFLHIGALGARKGTDEVIEAAFKLSSDHQKKVAILLVGKAPAQDELVYNNRIREVQEKTNVQIFWDNQFVPTPMMKSLFDQCFSVLLPYKNAEFSSGILGHAAAAKKPVIATNAGLIKELVSDYNLGLLLERPNAYFLAEKIEELLNSNHSFEEVNSFVKEHTPKKFAETLLLG